MDAVNQVLEGITLRSTVFSRLELGPDWGFSKDRLEGAPFHIVLAGEAWVGASDRSGLERLGPGDMAIATRGQSHLLLSAPDAATAPWKEVAAGLGLGEWQPGLRIKPLVLKVPADAAPCARLLSGIFEVGDRRRNPLLSALPDLLVLRSRPDEWPDRPGTVIALIDHEVEGNGPGAAMVAGRLADYLFVQAVREYLLGHTDARPGWLRGLRDPVISRALSLMHADPELDWTVEGLARSLSMSRSHFAERFGRLVGRGPIEYLTEWRMYQAHGRLNAGHSSLREIATLAGYASVGAFGRAFKRWSGRSPAASRRLAQQAKISTDDDVS